jgi:putative transposase
LLPSDNLLLNAPQIVNKRQRRLKGIDEIVLSLTAKGLTTEEVAAHFRDIYGQGQQLSTFAMLRDFPRCASSTPGDR